MAEPHHRMAREGREPHHNATRAPVQRAIEGAGLASDAAGRAIRALIRVSETGHHDKQRRGLLSAYGDLNQGIGEMKIARDLIESRLRETGFGK